MVLPLSVICGATWTTFGLTLPHFVFCSSGNKDRHIGGNSKKQQFWSKVFFTAIALSLLLSVVWITGCLVLLTLPTRSQMAVDGVFTLLVIAYGVTMLTSHCLRPQMQSCALCCHIPEKSPSPQSLQPGTMDTATLCSLETSSQKSYTTGYSISPKSTLPGHHSGTDAFSSTPKPSEIAMQDIAMIETQANDDALDAQSLHINFGAEEVHSEADTNTEDNAASPLNWKVHGDCLLMENKMADNAV